MLSIRNIVKQYANHCALDDVSLEVEQGKIFGLLGPNGAGKTSLIRVITQITAPDSGEVILMVKSSIQITLIELDIYLKNVVFTKK
jgi:ABC-type multidrug transport system ATPase subunit